MSQMESEANINRGRHDDSFTRAFLQNPSKEFLQENFTKPQLQKQCQLLGLRNIWVRKNELIDMIADYYSEQEGVRTLDEPQNPQQGDATNDTMNVEITAINRKLEQLERRLESKDNEIVELKNRLIEAEDQVRNMHAILQTLQRDNMNDQQCQTDKKTLIIGDSTLDRVRASDLDEACVIRTIHEANFSLIKSWLANQLTHPLRECIIYCGLQDLMEKNMKIENILDTLGCIVSELKSKNDEIKVSVCELIPHAENPEIKERVEHFNVKLVEWCTENSISVIKTELSFRLGTGDIDINCFDDDEAETTLSRIGIIRLLKAIDKMRENKITSEKFRNTKRTEIKNVSERSMNTRNTVTKSDNERNRNYSQKPRTIYKNSITSKGKDWNTHKGPNQQTNISPRRDQQYRTTHYSGTTKQPEGRYGTPGRGIPRQRQFGNSTGLPGWGKSRHHPPYPHPTPNPHPYPYSDGYGDKDETDLAQSRRVGGCYNCGEFNHRQNLCRFDHRIKCGSCARLGHKSKACKSNWY